MNNEYQFYQLLCKLDSIKTNKDQLHLIQSLKDKGLNFVSQDDKLILLEPISLLSIEKIIFGLSKKVNTKIEHLELVYETESTNKCIVNKPIKHLYSILVAEFQSNGQGRRQNIWSSPLGTNLYFSIKFNLTKHANSSFIPLITARAICKSFQKLGINGSKIKWPNDIYIDGAKVAGILAENRYSSPNNSIIIVGIGINVNMLSQSNIDQKWTSLKLSQNKSFDRNIILSNVLNYLISEFENLTQFNIDSFIQDWEKFDFLKGKSVKITDEKLEYTALVHGIADDGSLLVESNNKMQHVYSGNVSLKSPEFK